MDIHKTLAENIESLVDIARFSPSVHNIQPWVVSVKSNYIEVHVDKLNHLVSGDPTKRQTFISLGVFCEALSCAAADLGLTVSEMSAQQNSVLIHFDQQNHATRTSNSEWQKLLKDRSTDRSIYHPVALQKQFRQHLENTHIGQGIEVRAVTDRIAIEKIALLTSKSIGLALHNPSFRSELSRYVLAPWSNKKRGIAIKSLYLPKPLMYIEPLLLRLGLGISSEAALEKKRWLSASAVIVILAEGDLIPYWVNVGRTYLQLSLAIEDQGLSQATSAAIVEASNYHEDIEELLHTKKRILALIRTGQGSRKRYYSPRVPTKDLLTLN